MSDPVAASADHPTSRPAVGAVPADPARMHRNDDATEAMARAIVAYAIDRIRLDPPPLDQPSSPAELDRLGQSVTGAGIGQMPALRLFCEHLAPACVSQDHPRQLAFVPSAPTEAAVLFDLVVGASCIYGGSWMEGAGAVWAENQALRWIADLAGMPTSAGGVFVSGGSAANLSALVAARHRARQRRGARPNRWWIAVSSEAHISVATAANVMDVEVMSVPTDDTGHMTGAELRRTLEAHRWPPGDELFAVVATAGTTNIGAIDDLNGIAELCAEYGLWMHVDGAYGGAALAAPSVRDRFDGIERADSFVVDPHKWLFAPYDCAALLYRDPSVAAAAHAQHAGYLDVLHDAGEWNPSDYAFHLTRRARGLPFWYSLAAHGTDAYRDAVEAGLATARTAARLIEAHPRLELVLKPELSAVLFRRPGWSGAQYYAWSDRLLADQVAFCVPTTWRGETLLRFCFVHPRTETADVESVLETLR